MSYVDDIMDFDPQDLNVFNEEPNNYDQNIYKTNPVNSKSEDGRYRSKIKILYNPFSIKDTIVKQCTYALNDGDGFFLVRSKLANGDKSCPLFTGWKKLRYSGDEQKKEWANTMYDKNESQWVLIQVLEDNNKPELVGQFKVMKLPKVIYEKMIAKMKPSPESKKPPIPITDYLIGLTLDMDVQPGIDDPTNPSRKQREISYTLCEFGEYSPIIKTDGSPLFNEEELEIIDNYATAKENLVKAKTENKKKEAQKNYEEAITKIKPLYSKAIDYMKENALDLVKECGYKEWDEYTTNRVNHWIAIVANMEDPKMYSLSEWPNNDGKFSDQNNNINENNNDKSVTTADDESIDDFINDSEDLPF